MPSDSYADVPEIIEYSFKPTYIPNEFEKVSEQNAGTFYKIGYLSFDGKQYVFYQYTVSSAIDFDTEKSTFEKRNINGTDYFLHDMNGSIQISWSEYNYVFCIWGDISQEEAIKIANSIK